MNTSEHVLTDDLRQQSCSTQASDVVNTTVNPVLYEQLFQNVKKLLTGIEKGIKQKLSDSPLSDLTLAEISIIDVIGLHGEKTIKEIADALQIALSTPTKTMDRLVLKGYITRETSGFDRRMVVSRLTDLGKEAYKTIAQTRQNDIMRYLNCLTEEEMIQMINIMKRIHSFE